MISFGLNLLIRQTFFLDAINLYIICGLVKAHFLMQPLDHIRCKRKTKCYPDGTLRLHTSKRRKRERGLLIVITYLPYEMDGYIIRNSSHIIENSSRIIIIQVKGWPTLIIRSYISSLLHTAIKSKYCNIPKTKQKCIMSLVKNDILSTIVNYVFIWQFSPNPFSFMYFGVKYIENKLSRYFLWKDVKVISIIQKEAKRSNIKPKNIRTTSTCHNWC